MGNESLPAVPVPVRSLHRDGLALPAVGLAPPLVPAIARPAAVRLPLGELVARAVRVPLLEPPRVTSYHFAHAAAPPPPPRQRAVPAAAAAGVSLAADPATASPPAEARPRTRIAPPRDVVKLGERFFYLLQPDLETMLQGKLLIKQQKFWVFLILGEFGLIKKLKMGTLKLLHFLVPFLKKQSSISLLAV